MNKRIKAPELRTERLVLRDMEENDTSFIVGLRSNPQVYKYFVSPHKITEDEHLSWYQKKYIFDNNRFDWIGVYDEMSIGVFGAKRDGSKSSEAEVSYILSPTQYGKGFASEAIQRIILFCSEEWNCNRVIAEIHKDNIQSIKFIKKLGFVENRESYDFIQFSLFLTNGQAGDRR